MIACENESECEHKFNEVYSAKKTITNLKKTGSSDSLQSFESDVIEHGFLNKNETNNTISNKIRFRLLDDVNSINVDNNGNIELSVSLSSSLNILTIDKIKLSKKMSVNDINIYSNDKIIYKKDDIFTSVNYNYIKNRLQFSGCDKDIVINMKINNKNINNVIGKCIYVSYTNTITKEKHKINLIV